MNIDNLISFLLTENVDESIRSLPGKKFRMNEFTKLVEPQQMHKYAREHLRYLGEGSSRTVFLLSSRYVLKLAGLSSKYIPDRAPRDMGKGLGQNKAEIEISHSPIAKDLVAHTHQIDPGYKWIVADLVRPVSRTEFRLMTGISSGDLLHIFSGVDIIRLLEENPDLNPDDLYHEDLLNEHDHELATNPFVSKLARAAAELSLLPGDIHVDHFGKTPDGRIVLFDYGFTQDVLAQHYRYR